MSAGSFLAAVAMYILLPLPVGGDNFLMMMIRRQMRLRELKKENDEADDRAFASSGP